MKRPTITSVTSYLNQIFEDKRPFLVSCYRGQSDQTWELKPSVLRGLKPNAETKILSELLLEAPSEFGSDKLMFDKLVRAQHYGLPTRLLDVSLNPLVGLFFACNEEEHWKKDGSVQIFRFHRDGRVKSADSDTVSLLCNLAKLDDNEKTAIRDHIRAHKTGKWSNEKLTKFRELPAMRRLNQFIRDEKPYFLDIANPTDLIRYFFVHPRKNNRRVIAQSGAFIAAGLLEYRAATRSAGFKYDELPIPAKSKKTILDQLAQLNITQRTMYPEIEYTSRYIKAKWKASDGAETATPGRV